MPRAIASMDGSPVLEVTNLHKHFGRNAEVRAVDGVSFTVGAGEIFGIVGESGSGKSTLGRLILKLAQPTSGSISIRGQRIDTLSDRAFRPHRRALQVVLQDPLASFDPHWTIRRSLQELAQLRPEASAGEERWDADAAVASVGLDPRIIDRYPSQVSGGQLQRLSIARALAPDPDLLILDEPTSALDVSVRGGIVNLLMEKCAEAGLTVVLISHDFAAIRAMSDRVAVMYRGRFVEVGPGDAVLHRPKHPYTRGLIDAHSLGEMDEADRTRLTGELGGSAPESDGCALVTRCPFAEHRCEEPQTLVGAEVGHEVRCWKSDELNLIVPDKEPATN